MRPNLLSYNPTTYDSEGRMVYKQLEIYLTGMMAKWNAEAVSLFLSEDLLNLGNSKFQLIVNLVLIYLQQIDLKD